MAVLERVLSGNTRLDVDRTLSSHTLYLKLWTDRGEVALSMTASMIGPEHEAQRPVALYGQVLDHEFIAGLQGTRSEHHESGSSRRGEGSNGSDVTVESERDERGGGRQGSASSHEDR